MKEIKWILGIAFSLIFSIMSWNSLQLYNLNADNEVTKINTRLIQSNLEKSDNINIEKNKNCNKRIDRVVDEQGEINKRNTEEHKEIMIKLDKIYNYQMFTNYNFKKYILSTKYDYAQKN